MNAADREADHAARCWANSFPWCDTCKGPAVFREGIGDLHSTADHPFGLYPHLDTSGHTVTTREWWAAPTSQQGPGSTGEVSR